MLISDVEPGLVHGTSYNAWIVESQSGVCDGRRYCSAILSGRIANRLREAGANTHAQGGAPHSLKHIMATAGNEAMKQLFPDNEGTADSASHTTHWKLDILFTAEDGLSEEKLQALRENRQALGGSVLEVGSFEGDKRRAWLILSWDG